MASRTYTGTLFYPTNLTEATVELFITNKPKWDCDEHDRRTTFTGVKSWTIVEGGEEAAEIESQRGMKPDEEHEYLVLEFENGRKKTYRNSHVAMFIW